MVQDVVVSVAPITLQEVLQARIMRQENLRSIPFLDEFADYINSRAVLRIAVVPVLEIVFLDERVEFDEAHPLRERDRLLYVIDRLVDVAQDDSAQIVGFFLHDVQYLARLLFPGCGVYVEGRAGLFMGPYRGPHHFLLIFRYRPACSYFADDPTFYACFVHAVSNVPDYLRRQLVNATLAHVLGMRILHVETGTRDYVQSRDFRDVPQPSYVPPEADRGAIHDGLPAGPLVVHQFSDGQVAIQLEHVVLAQERVSPEFAKNLHRDRHLPLRPAGRIGYLWKEAGEINEDVLVAHGDAQVVLR